MQFHSIRYAMLQLRHIHIFTYHDLFLLKKKKYASYNIHTLLDQPEDHVVLLLGLNGYEVHAVLPAEVPGVEPVNLLVRVGGHVAAEEVVVAPEVELLWP